MKRFIYQWLLRTALALVCLLTTTSAWAETWTVAGEPAALFGTTWAPSLTANDMTSTDGVNYTWSKENVELTAGIAQFKVVKDHSWDNTAYPSSNYKLSIPSNGTYNVTITFNSSNNAVNATIETVATTPDEYTIVGGNATLFGTTWDTGNTANNMTETNSGVYSLTKSNVELTAGNIEYKAVKNHAYDNGQWPSSGNNSLNIPSAGIYDVTFTLDLNNNSLTATATKLTPEAPTFSPAAGTYNSNQNVTISCATTGATIYYTTDGSNPTTSSTVYSGAIALNSEATTTIKAIAAMNGYTSSVAEATYTIVYDRFYVVGEPNDVFPTGWTIGDAQLMTASGTTWTWTKSPIALAADATIAFKVKKKSGNTETWIPSEGGNITVSPGHDAGNYALTITYVEGEASPTATLTPLFVTTPVFSPAPGTYDSNQNVTITAASGTIYYTTDGSDPSTSSTRMEYTAPIPMHHEDNFTFKAVAVDGDEVSAVAEADYTIKYVNIYLFGSVGKQHTWLYSYTNPEMTTSDGVNYYGVFDILNMPTYTARENAGLFLLTTGFGTTWETTQQYMIGTTASNNFWIDGDHNYLDEWVDAAPVGQSDKGWTIVPPNGHGTYEFFYNKKENKFKLAAFDGPTIYVYDYTRPYIYVKDGNNVEFNGEMPGNPIQILDESVGGHSGLSTAADGSGLGNGTLGWYKFAVPSHDTPITFQFYHNNDKTVVPSGPLTTTGDCYYYWDGAQYVKLNSRDDAVNLRRIVTHVRVQGTTVPTCDNQPMNGPSSFYGQMYYWMAVTKYNAGERMVITDGTHHYDQTITSDVYLEWTDAQGADYVVLSSDTLEHRLANKTGRGTIIHLQKNRNTPAMKDGNVVGIDTKVQDGEDWTNTTNLGTTWWGTSLESDWKGTQAWTDGVLSNYDNSRYIYNAERGDVFTITAEDGTEWYTWYCDRSTASISFGYGEPANGYPTYSNDKNVDKFNIHYQSPQLIQTAGEVWYVWTPDFDNPGTNNGEILDVTRMYESSAKQKALCSTFRDGNYVYYTDIKGWGDDNVYCYVWTVPGIDWPGVKMVKVGYDDEGHPVYLADLSNYDVTNADGILFNNGVTDSHATNKRQTGNLEWVNHGCYDYLGLLYRIGGNVDVIENEPDGENSSLTLRGVWYSRVKGTLFAKGDNDYNNKSVNSRGYIDFAKVVTDGSSSQVLQDWDYDQSNWVEIYPSESVTTDDLKALLEQEFTLYGTKLSSVNPRFKAISISNQHNTPAYTLNHFTPAHFNGTPFLQRRGDNEWYFFVEPKPNELAKIYWSIYNEGAFYAYKNAGFDGTIEVDWSYHDPGYTDANMTTTVGLDLDACGKDPKLTDLNGFSGWLAIIKFNETTAAQYASAYGDDDISPSSSRTAKYTVYPIRLNDDMATAIETITPDKASGMRTLKSTRYYNMMGVESSTPFQGVNIIVKEYTDGSRESSKAIVR